MKTKITSLGFYSDNPNLIETRMVILGTGNLPLLRKVLASLEPVEMNINEDDIEIPSERLEILYD